MYRVTHRVSFWIAGFTACAVTVSTALAQPDAAPAVPESASPPTTEPAPGAQPAAAPAAAVPPTEAAPAPATQPAVAAAAQTPAPPVAPPQAPKAASPPKPKPPFLAQSFLLRAELGVGYGRAHGGEGPDGNAFIGGITLSIGGFVVPRFALHADFSGGGTTTFHYKETDDFEKVSGTTSFWGYAGGGATAHVGNDGLLLSGGIGVSAISAIEWSSVDNGDGTSVSSSDSEWSKPGFSFTLALAQQFRVRNPLGIGWGARYYYSHYGKQDGDIVQLRAAHLLTLNFVLTFNPQLGNEA